MTPFEFVLIFFIGGLTLTSVVNNDRSFSNALVQIVTMACLHFVIAALKGISPAFGLIVDGTPIVLLQKGQWQTESMSGMRIADDDVMATARDQGLMTLDQIDYAILERNGEISVVPVKEGN